MTYLVDSNVLSEPTRPSPVPKVVDWLTAHEADIVVDAIVLAELWAGVLTLPRGRKRTALEQWLEKISQTIECVPWDSQVAKRWATLVADLKRKGRPLPLLDSMIAATALAHGLTIATRNTDDFKVAGVKVLDPFA
jgi:predicted nucleic acid-binding protein